MTSPKVRGGRLAKTATVLMLVLGAFTLLVNVTIAVIIIALGIAMYLFERYMVRRVGRTASATSDP